MQQQSTGKGAVACGKGAVACLIALVSTIGCAHVPTARAGDLAFGLQRGGRWSGFTWKDDRLVGPRINAGFSDGALTGFVDGRGFTVDIENGRLSGTGTAGNIAVDVSGDPAQIAARGFWNNSRLRLELTPAHMEVTVPVTAGNTFGSVDTCQYVLDSKEPGVYEGSSICHGLAQPTRLEFPPSLWKLPPERATAALLTLLMIPPTTSTEPLAGARR